MTGRVSGFILSWLTYWRTAPPSKLRWLHSSDQFVQRVATSQVRIEQESNE